MNHRILMSLLALTSAALLSSAGSRAVHAAPSIAIVPITRDGQASPDANGSFPTFFDYGEPFLNDSGQVVFSCRLVLTAGGSADNEVLVRGRGGSAPVLIAREGQAIPDGPGLFGGLQGVIRQYAMNDSGRVVFVAPLTGTAGGTSDN